MDSQIDRVSILVLMDTLLQHILHGVGRKLGCRVSILVLMDTLLQRIKCRSNSRTGTVSILVLMDTLLQHEDWNVTRVSLYMKFQSLF